MEGGNRVILFLFCLALSCFVAQTHGKQKEQGIPLFRNSGLKPKSSGALDTSLFEQETAANIHIPQEGSKEGDKIGKLPGQPPVDFSQYGGYVTVNKVAGRALYYYFAEADNQHKASLPLLLWLNGGPGCSSLAYGAMQELGPFRVHSDGKTLFANRFAWNKAANVLFLESPAGVGFSYSNTTSEYETRGDTNTAEDNYAFLVNWLERFPQYKNRPFYIAGESYAGHYVPQLAHIILHHNKKATKAIINLKGIIIGNAVINEETDNRGMYDFLASHALVTDEDAYNVINLCDSSPNATTQSNQCIDSNDAINNAVSSLDIYNIYAPRCFSSNVTERPKKASILQFDPCSDNYVYFYLNRPDVQSALHANVTRLTHDWEACSDVISGWGDSPPTIIPLLQEFMANGLRVWVFSGDIDGRVPVTSTKYSIKKMNLPVKTAWHAWYLNGEVGGYTEVYKGDLTFATVREAGHQVPSYQPARGLSLISHFLNGTPLPNTARPT
ncbi:hypothetical protein I3760_14G005500 [Carya illinoinensis]|nr:hypothetical protein I3760_14G005500 [Carya illinoinensis]